MSEEADKILPISRHRFSVNQFSAVTATDKNGGSIESQTVEALLLYEILRELQAIRVQAENQALRASA